MHTLKIPITHSFWIQRKKKYFISESFWGKEQNNNNSNKLLSSLPTAQYLMKERFVEWLPWFLYMAFGAWPRYLASSSSLQKMPSYKTSIPLAANKSNSHITLHPSQQCNWSGSPSRSPFLLQAHAEKRNPRPPEGWGAPKPCYVINSYMVS